MVSCLVSYSESLGERSLLFIDASIDAIHKLVCQLLHLPYTTATMKSQFMLADGVTDVALGSGVSIIEETGLSVAIDILLVMSAGIHADDTTGSWCEVALSWGPWHLLCYES